MSSPQTRTDRGWALGVSLVLIPLLLLCTTQRASALDPQRPLEHLVLDTWSSADGLLSDSVLALAQTPDGFLWIGTQKGLCRYDGLSFIPQEELVGKPISSLLVDRTGALWIASEETLFRHHRGELTEYPVEGAVEHIELDARQGLWVASDAGLWRLESDVLAPVRLPPLSRGTALSSLLSDSSGDLWIATSDGLIRRRGEDAVAVELPFPSGDCRVRDIHEDAGKNVWIATDCGVFTEADGVFHERLLAPGPDRVAATSMTEDRDGTMWIGAPGHGLFRVPSGRSDEQRIGATLHRSLVSVLLEDREGSLWIGTEGSGLARLREGRLTTLTPGVEAENHVLSVFEDGNDRLWAGTALGLFEKREHGWRRHEGVHDALQGPSAISALTQGGDGVLWLGTREHGLLRLSPRGVTRLTRGEGLLSESIRALLPTDDEGLWIGTDRGLSRYRGGDLTSYRSMGGVPIPGINALHRDRQGALWIGTDGALLRVRDSDPENAAEVVLSDISVVSISQSSTEAVWVATLGAGLIQIQGDKRVTFTTASGLPTNNILGVLEDGFGSLWLTSDEGILRTSSAELQGCEAPDSMPHGTGSVRALRWPPHPGVQCLWESRGHRRSIRQALHCHRAGRGHSRSREAATPRSSTPCGHRERSRG